jgi:hypothetical protein
LVLAPYVRTMYILLMNNATMILTKAQVSATPAECPVHRARKAECMACQIVAAMPARCGACRGRGWVYVTDCGGERVKDFCPECAG